MEKEFYCGFWAKSEKVDRGGKRPSCRCCENKACALRADVAEPAAGLKAAPAEINMIPLIDVMLVLLVIFIVTAPLLTHAVKVDLPKASSAPNHAPPARIEMSLEAKNRLWWNGVQIDAASLPAHLEAAARQSPPPVLHLRAERSTPYEKLAEFMSAAARAGLTRIGFITEPVH